MSLFSLLVYDYLGARAGTICFWASVAAELASVLYWHFTEAAGHGDLCPYAMVQFCPMIAAPILMLSVKGKVSYVRYMAYILGWYMP